MHSADSTSSLDLFLFSLAANLNEWMTSFGYAYRFRRLTDRRTESSIVSIERSQRFSLNSCTMQKVTIASFSVYQETTRD